MCSRQRHGTLGPCKVNAVMTLETWLSLNRTESLQDWLQLHSRVTIFVSMDFNYGYVASVIAALTLTLGVKGPITIHHDNNVDTDNYHLVAIASHWSTHHKAKVTEALSH